MDLFSLLGIFIGLAAITFGQYLEGGSFAALINIPAFIIVVGGTFGAVMLETPIHTLKQAFKFVKKAFIVNASCKDTAIANIVGWSKVCRKDGFLGIEKFIENSKLNNFTKSGLQMLVDGKDSKYIVEHLQTKLAAKEANELRAIKVFESMGGYSPTIGIIGAVLGLMHVLGNLDSPENLGPGIAVAFVATIYGVGFANLLYIPISKRLKNILFSEIVINQMTIEGIASISLGENPHVIERKLRAFTDVV
jgi:chemotaxis protein MotA